ncbi:MAG TPA: hypothetical protein VN042_12530 [Asticcacaulis sp.]|nr:hypothetical protein [Asticcacaulis sp.]
MAISGDYPHPVQINGFTCKNCTDVDYAKKHIDPAHPRSGPYGVNAASDPSQKTALDPATATTVQLTAAGRLVDLRA